MSKSIETAIVIFFTINISYNIAMCVSSKRFVELLSKSDMFYRHTYF